VTYLPDYASVLLNNGDGTFQSPHEYATGTGDSNPLAVADLNGDGRPDLVTAEGGGSGDPGTVTLLFNGGDGSFTRRSYRMGGGIIPLFGGPVSASVADLNGDGRPDIVTVDETYDYFPVGISVLRNRGDGTFARTDHAVGPVASGNLSVTISDLNGDGRPDLIMPDDNTSSIQLLLNKGDGTFEARRDYPGPSLLERVAIGDVNGEGRPDLIGASSGAGADSDTISVRLNTPVSATCRMSGGSRSRPRRPSSRASTAAWARCGAPTTRRSGRAASSHRSRRSAPSSPAAARSTWSSARGAGARSLGIQLARYQRSNPSASPSVFRLASFRLTRVQILPLR
jgi:FG-GAP-like repeat